MNVKTRAVIAAAMKKLPQFVDRALIEAAVISIVEAVLAEARDPSKPE